jgi:hypothetical protein
MGLQSGKHAGKTTETLLLKSPDWAQWMMSNHPDNPVSREFRRLVARFDAKPFTKICDRCRQQATRASAYQGSGRNLMFWCDDCNPYSSGASSGRLTVVRTFDDALRHIEFTCTALRGEKRDIINALAKGKGLPSRVGDAQAEAFFE